MRTRYKLLLLALAALATATLVVAARAQDREPEDAPGRFVPSEEVSADLPVSFPVDI